MASYHFTQSALKALAEELDYFLMATDHKYKERASGTRTGRVNKIQTDLNKRAFVDMTLSELKYYYHKGLYDGTKYKGDAQFIIKQMEKLMTSFGS